MTALATTPTELLNPCTPVSTLDPVDTETLRVLTRNIDDQLITQMSRNVDDQRMTVSHATSQQRAQAMMTANQIVICGNTIISETSLTGTSVITNSANNTFYLHSNGIQIRLYRALVEPGSTCEWYTSDSIFTGTGITTTTTGFYSRMVGSSEFIYYDLNFFNPPETGEQKLIVPPIQRRTVRQSIKRALKLITGLGFGNEVQVLLSGGSIELSHHNSEFKFVITMYNKELGYKTANPSYSTPFKMELYTKTNVYLGKLCVYIENTPILDQLLIMAMYIQSGDEDELLSQANFPNLTKDLEMKEYLVQHKPYLKDKLLPSPNVGGTFIAGSGLNVVCNVPN